MPASSAVWMIRIDLSWSGSPHAPNIIAPRHRGLTLTPVLPRVRDSIQRPYALLVLEQRSLGVQATGVPGQGAVGAHHAVARHDDRDLVAAVGAADRTRDAAQLARDLTVGRGLALRDLTQPGPDGALERRAVLGQRQLERVALA